MRIIIIGAGKVGYTLAENLSKEGNNVVIIDKNSETLVKADENLDVMTIRGSGASTKVLIEADIKHTDLLIAVTSSDEVNMVCCLTGKKLGVSYTIARIRDPEYAEELTMLKEEIDIDMVINPEQAAAEEATRVLNFPSAINVENFAKGRVRMVEVKIKSGMSILGMSLNEVSHKVSSSFLVGAVIRNKQIIIPNGDFVIEENDDLYILGKTSSVLNFCKGLDANYHKTRNVMIVGGGRIAYYLTNFLYEMDMKVKIIEIDREKCKVLSEALPNTLVIHGDGTDEELLLSENLGDMDAFISMTGIDEENLMAALLAKQHGVKKVFTKTSRSNYINIVKTLGIDGVIIPKLITANQILKYVRGKAIESLYKLEEGQGEIIEFMVNASSKYLNIPLKKLKLPEDVIIATIVRKNDVIIPHGDDIIKKGDRVIVITKDSSASNLDEIFNSASGGIQSELQSSIKKLGNIINM